MLDRQTQGGHGQPKAATTDSRTVKAPGALRRGYVMLPNEPVASRWRHIGTGRKFFQIISWRHQAYTHWGVFCILDDLNLHEKNIFSWSDSSSTTSAHRSMRRFHTTPDVMFFIRMWRITYRFFATSLSLQAWLNQELTSLIWQVSKHKKRILRKQKHFLHTREIVVFKRNASAKKRQFSQKPVLHDER